MIRFIHWSLFFFACACLRQGIANEKLPSAPVFISELSFGYDSFRGVSEGSWNDNTGGVLGINLGLCMNDNFALQAGVSYGLYDWQGSGAIASSHTASAQELIFLTAGISYKFLHIDGFRVGAVIDAMYNRNFGIFGLNPSLQQAHLQAGYQYNSSNEVGLWGTVNIGEDTKNAFQIPVCFQAISQVNLFWRHTFENNAQTMLWAGIPYKKSLLIDGKKAGKGIIGVSFRVPLQDSLSLEGQAMYMAPESNSACPRSQNYGTNVCISLTYSLSGLNAVDNDRCQAVPYMSLADNSHFLVDTNLNN